MRADYDLAELLQYENIAWYEDGEVRILDRRIYPAEKEFVVCKTHWEVAKAITDMVTQSAGPYTAAPMGMALAAFECRNLTKEKQKSFLNDAAYKIANARPSTAKRMRYMVDQCLKTAYAILDGKDPGGAETAHGSGGPASSAVYNASDIAGAIAAKAIEMNDERYDRIDKIAKHLVDKIPAGGHVMTYCWAETIVGMMLRNCRQQGKEIKLYCNETRPYFQGARLTASCAHDMGFDVTVITDGMPAYVFEHEGIDIFTTAADAICMDGSVINKVGTCNTAIVAKHFGVPYYVTGAPEVVHKTAKDVPIEQRGGDFTLQAMGVRTAKEGVNGLYPSFDATPPELVTGIATEYGIFAPAELDEYFKLAGNEFKVVV